MPNQQNLADTVTLTVSTTPRVKEYLEAVTRTGLYGNDLAEVIGRLIGERIRRQRDDERRLTQAATRLSEAAFQRVWDNDEDAVYDQL